MEMMYSQTFILWYGMHPGLSPELPGALQLVVGAPRFVASAPRCSKVHLKFSPTLRSSFNLMTITPIVLHDHLSEIPVTPKASWNPLIASDTLLKLTHLSLHSTSFQTLLETPSNKNSFCWWGFEQPPIKSVYSSSVGSLYWPMHNYWVWQ